MLLSVSHLDLYLMSCTENGLACPEEVPRYAEKRCHRELNTGASCPQRGDHSFNSLSRKRKV